MRITRVLAWTLGTLALAAGPAVAAPTVTEFSGLTSPGAGIPAGPAGALGVPETANPGRPARLTTGGAVDEWYAGIPGWAKDKQPTTITAGPDGALWFVSRNGGVS